VSSRFREYASVADCRIHRLKSALGMRGKALFKRTQNIRKSQENIKAWRSTAMLLCVPSRSIVAHQSILVQATIWLSTGYPQFIHLLIHIKNRSFERLNYVIPRFLSRSSWFFLFWHETPTTLCKKKSSGVRYELAFPVQFRVERNPSYTLYAT